MQKIYYKKGYKYQLFSDYEIQTDIYPDEDIDTYYLSLSITGKLLIKKSYAWDGASGIAIDTANFMRASLVHDALYQLMRMGKLDSSICRLQADNMLFELCIEDGMSLIRAKWVYYAVRFAGGAAASVQSLKEVLSSP